MISSRLRVAALVLGLAVAFSGCSLFQHSSAPNDGAIVAEIQSKLYQDPVLKTRDVRVISQKGVVVLTGTVQSNDEKTAVEHIAQGADGAKQVIDDMTVSSAPMAAAQPPTPAAPEQRGRARHSRRSMAENEPPPEAPSDESAASAAPAPVVQAPPEAAPSAPPPPPQPVFVTIPPGTVIAVRTVDSIDSTVNRAGDEFTATVDTPVTAEGQIVIPRYSNARIRLVSVETSGHIKGRSALDLSLVSLKVAGKSYPVASDVYQKQSTSSRGKRSAEVIGGGSVLGAMIGAIAGGGKGAAIGAAVGAGGGTAVQEASKRQQVKIPSETELDFTLRSPLTVSLPPQSYGPSPQN
jgi:BON domain